MLKYFLTHAISRVIKEFYQKKKKKKSHKGVIFFSKLLQHFGKRKLSVGYDINFLNNCTINAWREKRTHTNTWKKE